jgi:hypothetical protein
MRSRTYVTTSVFCPGSARAAIRTCSSAANRGVDEAVVQVDVHVSALEVREAVVGRQCAEQREEGLEGAFVRALEPERDEAGEVGEANQSKQFCSTRSECDTGTHGAREVT